MKFRPHRIGQNSQEYRPPGKGRGGEFPVSPKNNAINLDKKIISDYYFGLFAWGIAQHLFIEKLEVTWALLNIQTSQQGCGQEQNL